MDALVYLLSLGFSGTDVGRAIVLLLIGSLLVTKRLPAWRVTVLLLIIDLALPYIMMLQDSDGHKDVEVALRGALVFHEDALVGFLVRAAGFYLVLRGTFSLRRKLQKAFPDDGNSSRLMPF